MIPSPFESCMNVSVVLTDATAWVHAVMHMSYCDRSPSNRSILRVRQYIEVQYNYTNSYLLVTDPRYVALNVGAINTWAPIRIYRVVHHDFHRFTKYLVLILCGYILRGVHLLEISLP